MPLFPCLCLSIRLVSGVLIINVAAVAFCFIFMTFCINYKILFCVYGTLPPTKKTGKIMCQCHNLIVIS